MIETEPLHIQTGTGFAVWRPGDSRNQCKGAGRTFCKRGSQFGILLSAMEVASSNGSHVEKSPYELKSGPYSSHSLALQALPKRGEGRWVLDVGCATGYASEILAVRGYRVVGVDRAGVVPERTSKNEMFVEADLDSGLPVLGRTFDFVLCLDILEHLRDPLQLLSQIASLLSPDGLVIASLPNSGNIYFRLSVLLGRFPADDRGLFDRTHLHFYTWDGWLQLFSQAGLRIRSVKPSTVPIGLALRRLDAAYFVGALETAWYWMARIWKKLFAYQFIVLATPREDHE